MRDSKIKGWSSVPFPKTHQPWLAAQFSFYGVHASPSMKQLAVCVCRSLPDFLGANLVEFLGTHAADDGAIEHRMIFMRRTEIRIGMEYGEVHAAAVGDEGMNGIRCEDENAAGC